MEVPAAKVAEMIAYGLSSEVAPPSTSPIHQACGEFAAMLQIMRDEHPTQWDYFYPCVVSWSDATLFLLRHGVQQHWDVSDPYERLAEDNAAARVSDICKSALTEGYDDTIMFSLRHTTVINTVALMLFDKVSVHWVAHRYGISIDYAPLQMVKLVKRMHIKDPDAGYGSTPFAFGKYDFGFNMYHVEMLSCTMRKDECDACGKSFGAALKKCAACNSVRYCSKECQKGHWKEHKHVCAERKQSVESGSKMGVSDYHSFRAEFLGVENSQGPVELLVMRQPRKMRMHDILKHVGAASQTGSLEAERAYIAALRNADED